MTPNNSFFGKIPFLRYSVAFILGNIFSEYFDYKYAIIILIIIAIWMVIVKKTKWFRKAFLLNRMTSIASAIIFILIGFIYTSIYKKHQFSDYMPLKAIYTGTVKSKTISTNNRVKYEVNVRTATVNDTLYKLDEKILLYYSDSITNKRIYPGCNLLFESQLHLIKNNNNPGEFKYQSFMRNKGIRYQSYLYNNVIILSNESNTLLTIASRFRSILIDKYKQAGINNNELAVLSALTLGDKSYIDNELKSKFSSTGAMHVLAVSGLHVGILYVVLNYLLSFLGKKKYTRFLNALLLIIILWGFAFITGLSPSVMRACTMFSFIIIGEKLKRKTNIYNTLSLSAFILMLINPLLIYEVGFQLSYAAVTSIVFFQPKIYNLLNVNNKILKYLWGLLSVSIAAQIGTFPISIFYFHQFPVYFWISNFIVIPAAAILIYLAIVFFVVQSVPFLSGIITWGLVTSTKIMNICINFIDQLPGAVINNIWIDKFTMLILIAFTVTIAGLSILPKFRLLLITNVVLILLVGNAIKNSIQTNRQSLIIFYNIYNENVVSFINGKDHYYYSTSTINNNYTSNIIANSSGKFHTKAPVLLDSINLKASNIRIINNYILFKNLCIQLKKENVNEQDDSIENDLVWISEKSEIIIKKQENLRIRTFKKGKLKTFLQNLNESKINTRNEGALLLFFN